MVNLIENDSKNFPILRKNDWNTPAFILIQGLYDQATNEMRLDYKSPDSNKWTNRKWQVRILNMELQLAFVIPGGDLYISTGLLKALESESELYYLLSTEAILMNERYLLTEMIKSYSTKLLVDIAVGDKITDPRINGITIEVPRFNYGLGISDQIKKDVSDLICASSIYNPLMGESLEFRLSKNSQWLSTRPIGANKDQIQDCGDVDGKGLYETEVLDRL